MVQVNSLGTGNTFMEDAKRFGLIGNDIAAAARSWFEARDGAAAKTYYPFSSGGNNYKVELTYHESNRSLTCLSIGTR